MQALSHRSKPQWAKASVQQRLRCKVVAALPPSAERAYAATPTMTLAERQQQQEEHRRFVLEETKNFLAADLQRLFDTGVSVYAPVVVICKPLCDVRR
jgi:hypothetical protein